MHAACEPYFPAKPKIFDGTAYPFWKNDQFTSIPPPYFGLPGQMSGISPAPFSAGSKDTWPLSMDKNYAPESVVFPPFANNIRFFGSAMKKDGFHYPGNANGLWCKTTAQGFHQQGQQPMLNIPPPHARLHRSYQRKVTDSSPPNRLICRFCYQNGERVEFYSKHQLKDNEGRVTCPILRKYICQICGATGDKAHTKAYCPIYKMNSKSPLALLLKQTRHDSCGRIRK